MIRLITIRFSHYCEKARWALDRGRIAYEERSHLPLFAWFLPDGPTVTATGHALLEPR